MKNLIFSGSQAVYWIAVPNQRAPGQKLLPFAVSEKFIRELDAALAQTGYRNRSQFIRDAIIEKLARGCGRGSGAGFAAAPHRPDRPPAEAALPRTPPLAPGTERARRRSLAREMKSLSPRRVWRILISCR
jgi:hypothetical protein